MAYDSDKNYPFDIALDNFQSNLDNNKSRIVLGLSVDEQWGASKRFYESLLELKYRAYYQYINGYSGIMFWALSNKSTSDTKNHYHIE